MILGLKAEKLILKQIDENVKVIQLATVCVIGTDDFRFES